MPIKIDRSRNRELDENPDVSCYFFPNNINIQNGITDPQDISLFQYKSGLCRFEFACPPREWQIKWRIRHELETGAGVQSATVANVDRMSLYEFALLSDSDVFELSTGPHQVTFN